MLFCGGGKEDRSPYINPYLLIKPAIRVHIRVQHSKIHHLNLKFIYPQASSVFSL